jgi:HTH-type transcriptional regulator/antitoxin HigA
MAEMDDFFVMNDINQIDLNKVIEKYKHYKNSSIPDNYLKKHFRALLQDTNIKMMFRRNSNADTPLQEFWTLRFIDMAENNYKNLPIHMYSPLEKSDLKNIVNICLDNDIITKTKNYLMSKGIYLYFIDSLPNTMIDGAVYITSYSTIAVGLTLRYERLDYVWFTLLHELSHIILHYQYLSENIILSIENSQDIKEAEANRLARDTIISPKDYRVLLPKRTLNSDDLIKYAKINSIPPALIAGIIRKDINNYHIFNDIINNFKINRSDLYDGI